MTRILTLAAVIAAFGIGAFAALAEQGTPEQREACTPDVYRLCQAEIPDEKRIVACLKKNKKLLSKACYKVFFDK